MNDCIGKEKGDLESTNLAKDSRENKRERRETNCNQEGGLDLTMWKSLVNF